jgi:uncharacterized membrane protein
MIGAAWDLFRANWGVLVAVLILTLLISSVPGNIVSKLTNIPTRLSWTPKEGWNVPPDFHWGRFFALQVFNWIVGAVAETGALVVFIATARGRSPEISVYFEGMTRVVQYLPAAFLWGFLAIASAVPLIVPGVIVFLGFSLATSFAVDRQLGPIEALRASWSATKGLKGRLFVFYLLSVLLAAAGIAACCVGLVVAYPVISVAHALIYVRLADRAPVG